MQSVTPSNQNDYCWATADQPDVRDTINPATGTRSAACWYSGGSFDCLVTLIPPAMASCIVWPCIAWTGTLPDGHKPSIC